MQNKMISHVAQSLKLHCFIYFAFCILADTGSGYYSFCPFKYLGSYLRLAEGTLIRKYPLFHWVKEKFIVLVYYKKKYAVT